MGVYVFRGMPPQSSRCEDAGLQPWLERKFFPTGQEMNVYILYSVTALGVLLSLFSILFILLGKSVVGTERSSQTLKLGGIEARTNSVMALLIVSVVTAVLPLCLEFYLILTGVISVVRQSPEATPISEVIPMPGIITPALNTTISGRICEALKGKYRLHSDYVFSEGAGTRLTAKRASWNAKDCEPSKEAGNFVLKGEESTDYDIEVFIKDKNERAATGTYTYSSEVLIGASGRLISRVFEIAKDPPGLERYHIDLKKNDLIKDQSDIDKKIKTALEIRDKKYEGVTARYCTPALSTTAGRTVFVFICEGYTRVMVELY